MPNEDDSVSMDSTRGIDLLDPSLETVKDRALSLCLQALRFKGNPLWVQFLEQLLLEPSRKVGFQWKLI